MKKKYISIISIILCTFMTAMGQILWRLGAKSTTNFISYLNIYIILGFVVYGIGAILMIIALKFWELSKVHPFLALGFVWVTIFSPLILGEVITTLNIIGIIIIILGVIFIGK